MLLLLVVLVGCGRGPTFTRRSALGQEFDTTVLMTCRCHPETGKASYLDSDVTQGTMKMGTTVVIEGDVARYTSKMGAEPTTLDIGPGVILENPLYFPHVIQALAGAEGKQKRFKDFRILDTLKAEIQQATIRTMGEKVTAESLNVPGQTFSGTVEDNRIEGIFEIRHQRYDGQHAPPFPPDFGKDESLRQYLEPEDLVEADDPVLVSQAKELTKGAKDSWDALRRLSRWVGSQIGYAIPGGSARHTFDTRKGECGAHARLLTAFCRAVGIPARPVSGGMYTPLYGGSFGQHVWNEIYMGEAGWIPVDSTVQEVDYIDSGHIRLGSQTSFMPEKMEILDFKAGTVEKGKETAGLGGMDAIPWQAGKTYRYRFTLDGSPLGSDFFTVKDSYSCTTRLNLTGR